MLRAMQFEVQFRGFTVRVSRLGDKIGIRLDDGGVVPDMTPDEAAELSAALRYISGEWLTVRRGEPVPEATTP